MSILGPDALLAASITVEVAWPTDPGSGDAPTWTDITPWVRGLSIRRGRQYELDRVEAGTLVMELKNDDGRFDPTNTASPYYPYVLPLRQVRVRSFYDGLEYPLFWGYAERWPMRWESIVAGRTELAAVDGFAVLAQRTLRSVLAAEQFIGFPFAVYPFDEASGATTAGSIAEGHSVVAANLPAATVIESKYGVGTVTFGETAITFDSGGAVKIAGGDGSTTASAGSALQLATPTNNGPFCSTVDGFSVEVWFKAGDVSASDQWSLYAQSNSTLQTQLLSLRIVDTGEVTFEIRSDTGPGVAGCSTAAGQDDGEIHQIVASLSADNTTASLYLDGALVDTDTLSGAAFTAEKGWTQVGGVKSPSGMNVQFAGDLTVAYLALYRDIPLDAGQVADHYEAGTTGFAGELTGARLARVLGYAGWQGGSDLDAGQSTMSAATLAGRSALDAVQEVAEAEDGNLYIDAEGQVVFKQRHARYNQATVAVFGDPPGGAELPYAPDSEFDFDLAHVYSRVVVTPPVAAAATREDATAIERYFERTLTESPAIDTAEEAIDRASYRLARYKDPHLRMPALTVLPQRYAGSWPAVLGLDFGDPVEVTRDPDGAPAITTTSIVEAVEHQVTAEFWRATFALSPADINRYWVVEDATYGAIDGLNLVAY